MDEFQQHLLATRELNQALLSEGEGNGWEIIMMNPRPPLPVHVHEMIIHPDTDIWNPSTERLVEIIVP